MSAADTEGDIELYVSFLGLGARPKHFQSRTKPLSESIMLLPALLHNRSTILALRWTRLASSE
jgi:hypothetical protein